MEEEEEEEERGAGERHEERGRERGRIWEEKMAVERWRGKKRGDVRDEIM